MGKNVTPNHLLSLEGLRQVEQRPLVAKMYNWPQPTTPYSYEGRRGLGEENAADTHTHLKRRYSSSVSLFFSPSSSDTLSLALTNHTLRWQERPKTQKGCEFQIKQGSVLFSLLSYRAEWWGVVCLRADHTSRPRKSCTLASVWSFMKHTGTPYTCQRVRPRITTMWGWVFLVAGKKALRGPKKVACKEGILEKTSSATGNIRTRSGEARDDR